jgi:hypothetical protein
MLLISTPDKNQLRQILSDLLVGKITREAVLSWQKGVVAQAAWDVPIPELEGYWYFYSLMFVTVPFPDDYFLRTSDLEEYLADMDGIAGEDLGQGVKQLRSHQIDLAKVRWPLAMIDDHHDLMGSVPSVRGTYERRMDMVEHCHLQFEQNNYLLVKQFDEQAGQILLLGDDRNTSRATQLLDCLGAKDYILP